LAPDASKIKLFKNLEKLEGILQGFYQQNSEISEINSFNLNDSKEFLNVNMRKSLDIASGEYLENLMNSTVNTDKIGISNRKSIIYSENYGDYKRIYKIYKEEVKGFKFNQEEAVDKEKNHEFLFEKGFFLKEIL